MNLSDAGARFIASHEGMVLEPYNDPAVISRQDLWFGHVLGDTDCSVSPDELPTLCRNPRSFPLVRRRAFDGGFSRILGKYESRSWGSRVYSQHHRGALVDNGLSLVWPSNWLDSAGYDARFPCALLAPCVSDSNKRDCDKDGLDLVRQEWGQSMPSKPLDGTGQISYFRYGCARNLKRRESRSIPNIRSLLFEFFAKVASLGRLWDHLALRMAT